MLVDGLVVQDSLDAFQGLPSAAFSMLQWRARPAAKSPAFKRGSITKAGASWPWPYLETPMQLVPFWVVYFATPNIKTGHNQQGTTLSREVGTTWRPASARSR